MEKMLFVVVPRDLIKTTFLLNALAKYRPLNYRNLKFNWYPQSRKPIKFHDTLVFSKGEILQRLIQNPVKHPRRIVLREYYSTAFSLLTIFAICSILHVPETPLLCCFEQKTTTLIKNDLARCRPHIRPYTIHKIFLLQGNKTRSKM